MKVNISKGRNAESRIKELVSKIHSLKEENSRLKEELKKHKCSCCR